MSDVLSLEVVDADGAIREALDEAAADSRASFLKKAVLGGGAFLAGGVMFGGFPKLALGAPSPAQDVQILNFALLLEFLEEEFYGRAVRSGSLSGETLAFARVVARNEAAHARFLQRTLGSAARRKPRFDFGEATENQAMFQAVAMTLEDTGVAAYNGQGPNLTRGALAAAGQIVSVEARQAAWIRNILRRQPAPSPFDKPLTKAQVEARVRRTGFIQS
ncbi:MAG TPA: ferritin-like domain-containing protein [Gaiellaceae bacterium]|nr:ferritin-like domain-containing protein [Gaiellaceae bacterium]